MTKIESRLNKIENTVETKERRFDIFIDFAGRAKDAPLPDDLVPDQEYSHGNCHFRLFYPNERNQTKPDEKQE